MKIEIENYRNQVIYYNDDTDKFECDAVIEDATKATKRTALKDVRLFIDQFVKANAQFKPFKVFEIETRSFGEAKGEPYFDGMLKIVTIESVRKDGALKVVNEKGGVDYYDNRSYQNKHHLRKFNPAILDIQKEWDEAEKKWEAKKKELQEKALPLIETIDLTFINDFTK